MSSRHELQETSVLILSACCICGKIRDDCGNWQTAVAGQAASQESRYTHTLCPRCVQYYYAEFYQPDKAGHEPGP
ncbi:MAG: hypothetical protein ACUVRZ_12335 [Desulfobacca sp.]|uniref:hypothetical protein n=1 Tax=Desulfobacca sp. TaxID=2067990 RepID=UPI00404B18EB